MTTRELTRKETALFNRIAAAAKAAGAEARQTATAAGMYHDGTQHGRIYNIIRVSVDMFSGGHYNGNAATIAAAARRAIGRFKGVTIREIYHQSFYIYEVAITADARRAEELNQEARTFLEAYWKEEHRRHVNGEPDDHGKSAIEAGHAALTAAGYITDLEAGTAAGYTASQEARTA